MTDRDKQINLNMEKIQKITDLNLIWARAPFVRMVRKAISKISSDDPFKTTTFRLQNQTITQLHRRMYDCLKLLFQKAFKYTEQCHKIVTKEHITKAFDDMFVNHKGIMSTFELYKNIINKDKDKDKLFQDMREPYVKRISIKAGIKYISEDVRSVVGNISTSILEILLHKSCIHTLYARRITVTPGDLEAGMEFLKLNRYNGLGEVKFVKKKKKKEQKKKKKKKKKNSKVVGEEEDLEDLEEEEEEEEKEEKKEEEEKETYVWTIIQSDKDENRIFDYFSRCWVDNLKARGFDEPTVEYYTPGLDEIKNTKAFMKVNKKGEIKGIIIFKDYEIKLNNNDDTFIYYGEKENKQNLERVNITAIRELLFICKNKNEKKREGEQLLKEFEKQSKGKTIILDVFYPGTKLPGNEHPEEPDFAIHMKLYTFYAAHDYKLLTNANIYANNKKSKTAFVLSKTEDATHAFYFKHLSEKNNKIYYTMGKDGNFKWPRTRNKKIVKFNSSEGSFEIEEENLNFEWNDSKKVRFVKQIPN